MGAATARAVRPYRVLDDSARRAELAGTAAAVAEFDSLVRAARVEPLAVLIPDAGVVERWRQASVLRGVPPQVAVDFEYPNKVFDSLFAAHGIPCHDLTPAIRAAAAAGEQLYFRRDRHLNTRGNRLVGTLVAALLRRRG